ncbi:MAG: ribose 5-phosphate isomerase A [Victivallaceae bacterium]
MKRSVETTQEIKRKLGQTAANFVSDGMIVGLGTGSTCAYFITALIEKKREEGLCFKTVASSEDSKMKALSGGLEILDDNAFVNIDFSVDGADEIDPDGHLIKGGGGAFTREKVVLRSAKRRLIIADESKEVERLGEKNGLPLEVLPFGFAATVNELLKRGYQGKQRMHSSGRPFITDNGNFIFDVNFPSYFPSPGEDDIILKTVSGVIETGFFLEKADILIGFFDGTFNFKN